MTVHVIEALPFPLAMWVSVLPATIDHPWICALGTHHGWEGQGSMEFPKSSALSTWPHVPLYQIK